MCRFSRLLLLFLCKDGSDRLMATDETSLLLLYFSLRCVLTVAYLRYCCVLTVAYLRYCWCHLSCFPVIWHFLFIVTHKHIVTHGSWNDRKKKKKKNKHTTACEKSAPTTRRAILKDTTKQICTCGHNHCNTHKQANNMSWMAASPIPQTLEYFPMPQMFGIRPSNASNVLIDCAIVRRLCLSQACTCREQYTMSEQQPNNVSVWSATCQHTKQQQKMDTSRPCHTAQWTHLFTSNKQ